jgi:integrative and conjugative element protein (TIGR02256 family)
MRRAEVVLPEPVLEEMEREADRHAPDESGGVLLGYRDRDDPRLIQVVSQVGPGLDAVHEPYRFEPDAAWQDDRIAAAYAESGRVVTYLGDWHSHPQGSPSPSKLDRSTARRIARSRTARTRHPLIVILWGREGDWRVSPYRWARWRLRSAAVNGSAS